MVFNTAKLIYQSTPAKQASLARALLALLAASSTVVTPKEYGLCEYTVCLEDTDFIAENAITVSAESSPVAPGPVMPIFHAQRSGVPAVTSFDALAAA